jgi:hypothetical protein
MKIYVLLMLIGVIVGISYLPIRRQTRVATPTASDPVIVSIRG